MVHEHKEFELLSDLVNSKAPSILFLDQLLSRQSYESCKQSFFLEKSGEGW